MLRVDEERKLRNGTQSEQRQEIKGKLQGAQQWLSYREADGASGKRKSQKQAEVVRRKSELWETERVLKAAFVPG